MTDASHFFRSADGLRLHVRVWEAGGERLPALCLAGLTRSSDDFGPLAAALSSGDAARTVVAPDYRGRGASDHDSDWRHYDLATERDDVLAVLDALSIERVHLIGTSRGGLHAMAMASEHIGRLASVVLNDIGPVLEPAGLLRIKGYVGRPVHPASLDEAVRLMKLGDAALGFDGLTAAEWRHFAATTFGPDERALGLRYDPALARTLDAFDLATPLPDLWPAFDALAGVPILVLRGENSDLLSRETVAAMAKRRPGVMVHEVPGQAHAPLLADEATITTIAQFLERAEAG